MERVIGTVVVWLIAMLSKKPTLVVGSEKGKPVNIFGDIYSFEAEDGSGHNWIVRVGGHEVFVHIP